MCASVCNIVNHLSAHHVRGWLGLSEMQAQAYFIWIMYKTLIEAVRLHQSGAQEQETREVEKEGSGGTERKQANGSGVMGKWK